MPDLAPGEVLEDYYDPAHEDEPLSFGFADDGQSFASTDLPD